MSLNNADSGLLVGVDGTSRASTTRMAAFLCECELVQLEMPKSYGVGSWRADLRRLLWRAGVERVETVFLFTDGQARAEEFLEDVASILRHVAFVLLA